MKILLIQKMAGISGSEKYYLSLLPHLTRQGHSVHFLVVQHPKNRKKNMEFKRRLENDGVVVHEIYSYFPVTPLLIHRIFRLIFKEKFDLVQTNLIHADFWGACVKRLYLPNLKLLSVKHGYDETYQKMHGFDPGFLKKNLYYRLSRWSGKFQNKIVSISLGLANLLCDGGIIDRKKSSVIYYGFNFPENLRKVPKGGLRFGKFQMVIIGRLIEFKQHDIVLKILPKLSEIVGDMRLVVVGDGPLKERLIKLADELNVGHLVRWEGFKENVHDYIEDSDVMVLPSASEGFGLVILEAWKHAVPVVAFDVPAPNEIITNGEDGYLVKPFDMAELETRLAELALYPEKRHSLGTSGKIKLQQKFTLDIMARQTMSVYQEVVAPSCPSVP